MHTILIYSSLPCFLYLVYKSPLLIDLFKYYKNKIQVKQYIMNGIFKLFGYHALFKYNCKKYYNVGRHSIYKLMYKNDFNLTKVMLKYNTDINLNVTKDFKMINTGKISNYTIEKICMLNGIDNINIIKSSYLIFHYSLFNNNTIKNYLLFYKYNEIKDNILPYPFFNNDILHSFKKGIIAPYYNKEDKYNKMELFDFFNNYLCDIKEAHIILNNDETINIYDFILKIQSPFNDLGLLYKTPVYLYMLLDYLNINSNDFKFLVISFNDYFNKQKLLNDDHTIIYNINKLYYPINSKIISSFLR